MANDRWPEPGDAARSQRDAAAEESGFGEESLEALRAERRVVRVPLAGEERVIAAEEAGRVPAGT